MAHASSVPNRHTNADGIGELVEAIVEADQPAELFTRFGTFLQTFGVDVISYQIVADDLKKVPIDHGLVYDTFPEDWIKRYIDDDLETVDPMLDYARRAATTTYWSDLESLMALSEDQRRFLKDLHAQGLSDGLAVPIFSAIGDMAYFALGAIDHSLDLSAADVAEVTLACQLAHNRYVALTGGTRRVDISLSKREREVLTIAASGRSYKEIARQLDVSPHTVDTLLRRCFRKLGVNSRIEATLKAIGAGLILPEAADR